MRFSRVAVVGCGYWGQNLVRNFYELGALSMVVDVTETGRRKARKMAPNVPVCGDFGAALSSEVAAIVIATPAETHHELAARALEAGKDVFVEKPMTLRYEDGKDLVKQAEVNGRILMVGHVLEYHPAITKLLQLVRDGVLGSVRYIYSNRLSLGKIRREENILWSFAPHDIAVILRLVGEMPFQVSATGGAYIQPNIADVTVTDLLFDSGVRAHIFVSWLHPFKEQRLVVIGSKKMASFNDVSKELVLYDQRVEWREGQPVPVKNGGEMVDFPQQEPLRNECIAFLRAIETREPPVTEGRSGVRVLRVLQAAERSLGMSGEPVRLPLESFH